MGIGVAFATGFVDAANRAVDEKKEADWWAYTKKEEEDSDNRAAERDKLIAEDTAAELARTGLAYQENAAAIAASQADAALLQAQYDQDDLEKQQEEELIASIDSQYPNATKEQKEMLLALGTENYNAQHAAKYTFNIATGRFDSERDIEQSRSENFAWLNKPSTWVGTREEWLATPAGVQILNAQLFGTDNTGVSFVTENTLEFDPTNPMAARYVEHTAKATVMGNLSPTEVGDAKRVMGLLINPRIPFDKSIGNTIIGGDYGVSNTTLSQQPGIQGLIAWIENEAMQRMIRDTAAFNTTNPLQNEVDSVAREYLRDMHLWDVGFDAEVVTMMEIISQDTPGGPTLPDDQIALRAEMMFTLVTKIQHPFQHGVEEAQIALNAISESMNDAEHEIANDPTRIDNNFNVVDHTATPGVIPPGLEGINTISAAASVTSTLQGLHMQESDLTEEVTELRAFLDDPNLEAELNRLLEEQKNPRSLNDIAAGDILRSEIDEKIARVAAAELELRIVQDSITSHNKE